MVGEITGGSRWEALRERAVIGAWPTLNPHACSHEAALQAAVILRLPLNIKDVIVCHLEAHLSYNRLSLHQTRLLSSHHSTTFLPKGIRLSPLFFSGPLFCAKSKHQEVIRKAATVSWGHNHHNPPPPPGPASTFRLLPAVLIIMCYRIVELYSVCRCLYHRHSIDPCKAVGQRDHVVQEKEVLVGYACERHSPQSSAAATGSGRDGLPDSGYSSAGGYYQYR